MVAAVREETTARRYLDGEWLSEEDVIIKHNRLIHECAHRHMSVTRRLQSIAYEDLVSYASMGMILAYRGYKADFGAKFTTYAMDTMRKVLMREAEEEGNYIRFSFRTRETAMTIFKNGWLELPKQEVYELLNKQRNRKATYDEVVAAKDYLLSGRVMMSAEKPEEKGEGEVAEMEFDFLLKNAKAVRIDTSELEVQRFMNSLSGRERQFIEGIVDGYNQGEIAEQTGISRQLINWDSAKAKQKIIRFALENGKSPAYIDQLDPKHSARGL